jgi:hypothetical protein
MAIFASTTLGSSDPSRAMSIKALEARAQALATANAQQPTPQSVPSPWQGIGNVANTAADALLARHADQAAAARRQDLANIMSGVGAEGPNPQQLAGITSADPDIGKLYAQQAFAARQSAAERAQQEKILQEKSALDEKYAAAQEQRLQARPSDLEKTAGRPLTPEEQTAYLKKQTGPSAAEQKAIGEQQSQNIDLQSAVDQLHEAHGLLNQGIRPGGVVGEAATGIGKALPSVGGVLGIDPELTKRTDRFNQILAGQALGVVNSLKGATSDKDLQFAIKTINDPATSPANKEQALRVLIAKANAHLAASNQTLQTMGGAPVKVQTPSGAEAPAAGGGVQSVASEAEALKLPPGTKFKLPDGRTGTAR